MKTLIVLVIVTAILSGFIGARFFSSEKETLVKTTTAFSMPVPTEDLRVITLKTDNFKRHSGEIGSDDYDVMFTYEYNYSLGFRLKGHDWCPDINQNAIATVNKPPFEFLSLNYNPELEYIGGIVPAATALIFKSVPNSIDSLNQIRALVSEDVESDITQKSQEMLNDLEIQRLAENALKGFILNQARLTGGGVAGIEFKMGCTS